MNRVVGGADQDAADHDGDAGELRLAHALGQPRHLSSREKCAGGPEDEDRIGAFLPGQRYDQQSAKKPRGKETLEASFVGVGSRMTKLPHQRDEKKEAERQVAHQQRDDGAEQLAGAPTACCRHKHRGCLPEPFRESGGNQPRQDDAEEQSKGREIWPARCPALRIEPVVPDAG